MTDPGAPDDRDAIDPEQIALLLDGRFPPAEREALLARLAASPDALAAYADAVSALREVDASATRRRWWQRPGYLMAVAAALVALVAVPKLVERGRAPSDDIGSYLAAVHTPGGLPAAVDVAPWSGTRSSAQVAPAAALPWRVGAMMVDVEMAAGARDAAATLRSGADLASLLEQAGVPAATRSVYLDSAAITRGPDVAWLSDASSARRETERAIPDEGLRLGAWIEAARYAVASRDDRFFSAPRSRESMARLASLGLTTPAARQALDAASTDRMTPGGRAALAAALRDLLAAR